MIESFKRKVLKSLFENDDGRKVRADQLDRLRLLLLALNQADSIEDLDQPTFRLHPLEGNRRGSWSITVRANWRVTFRLANGGFYDLELEDYHYDTHYADVVIIG